MVKAAICGLLLLAAAIVAGYAPGEQKRPAILVGTTLCLIWIVYISAWFPPYCPASALWYGFGIDATNIQMWALGDALAGVVIVAVAGERWWGVAITLSLAVQGVTHVLAENELLPHMAYALTLETMFLTQLAVLFFIGGKGAKDRVYNWLLVRLDRGDAVRRFLPPAQLHAARTRRDQEAV